MKIQLLFSIIMLNWVLTSYAIPNETINGGILNDRVSGDPATIYHITGDCTIARDISLCAGSILKFEGGMINGSGKISGGPITIDAPKYKIFGDSVTIENIANSEVSAHWFGAIGFGSNDNAAAINKALRCAGTSWVILDNLNYTINDTIIIHKGQRLRCAGTISHAAKGAAIDLRGINIDLDINVLAKDIEYDGQGSGVLFTNNVYNSNININRITSFEKAFDLSPSNLNETDQNTLYRGIQYCKISWQYIEAKYGIYMDMVSRMSYNGTGRAWINENQFNGGRLLCQYGIYVKEANMEDVYNKKVAIINGNVFNSIGIEGEGGTLCKTAITLSNAWHNTFNDIRLSEGYESLNSIWIDLENCGYTTFKFKSLIPYSAVRAEKCNHIKIEGAICGNELGYFQEYDNMYIINESPTYNPLNTMDTRFCNTYKIVTRDFVPSAEFNRFYYGVDSINAPTGHGTYNIHLNDLMTVTKNNQIALSDKCFISVQDYSTLNVSTVRSLPNMRFPLTLFCKISEGSTINFVNSENKTIKITADGIYQVRPRGENIEIYGYYTKTDTITTQSKCEVFTFGN